MNWWHKQNTRQSTRTDESTANQRKTSFFGRKRDGVGVVVVLHCFGFALHTKSSYETSEGGNSVQEEGHQCIRNTNFICRSISFPIRDFSNVSINTPSHDLHGIVASHARFSACVSNVKTISIPSSYDSLTDPPVVTLLGLEPKCHEKPMLLSKCLHARLVEMFNVV